MTPDPDITVFRLDRPGIRKALGDLEAEIMEVIWSRPHDQGVTVREVFEALYARRRIAYTTVMTTMSRLAKKRLLRATNAAGAYVYSPNFTEQEFVARFVARILDNLFVGFTGATLEGLAALAGSQGAGQAPRLLEEMTRRRAAGEEA